MSLLGWRDALVRLLEGTVAVSETETLGLRKLAGRVAARDIIARFTHPPFDASAMDGYAVRATDVSASPKRLRVIGEAAAGSAFDGYLGTDECVRIFTGAPMPLGADAVVIQENTVCEEPNTIDVLEPVQIARHVRRSGNDFVSGETLIEAGSVFGPVSIALTASGGHAEVEVLRRPRIAILMTGDELVSPGHTPGPSQIVASNGYGIAAIVEAAGGLPLDYGIVRDDVEQLRTLLHRAVADEVDVLVTIGGASVGDHDLIGPVFRNEGVELDFWKVAMRPGKPLMAGRRGTIRFLGLPGNPASSLVTAELFLKPLILRLSGRNHETTIRTGQLGTDLPPNDHRTEFLRATLEMTASGKQVLYPLARQDSSLLSVFAQADALLVRPAHAPGETRGSPCEFIPLLH